MLENIHDIIKYFPECSRKIEEKVHKFETEEHDNYLGLTKQCHLYADRDKLRDVSFDVRGPKDICVQAMEYLVDVNTATSGSLHEAGCAYFYYWIYDVLKNGIKEISDIQDIYDQLIEIFMKEKNIPIINLCESNKNPIKNDDFHKIVLIYDLYNSIYKNDKVLPKEAVFEEALKILKRYYEELVSKPREIIEIVKEASCKNNSAVTIVITFFVTIMFTIFGSWWHNIINKKINRWNNTNEEWNTYQRSEIYSTISRDTGHNMLYFSP
ncbi:variable surface protein [Plasmodium gonderi]|uniref:Variable surface protein n=1 Tax=Plasmodium gonderi TaxID=77519 RepID=A0A1Y1JTB2_PLAGO|nr:variable surface protein [Plasmodium gonderi]GAW84685.1 variable surface protein [Plasmodium gonderi]